jgi:hypothetical protein
MEAAEAKKRKRRTYDPGKPALVAKDADGTYLVGSWRDPEASYRVDLAAGTCTCPDHTQRQRDCKHLRQVRKERWERLEAKARAMESEQLLLLQRKYEESGQFDIAVVILGELFRRTTGTEMLA